MLDGSLRGSTARSDDTHRTLTRADVRRALHVKSAARVNDFIRSNHSLGQVQMFM